MKSLREMLFGTRPEKPFELRVTTDVADDTDVFGATFGSYATLKEARRARHDHYARFTDTSTLPLPLVVVEVRHNCVVRYEDSRSVAIYGKGKSARSELLVGEMRFDLREFLART
jgi:hypothetical protein